MTTVLVIIAYLVYAAFWVRLSMHVFVWLKSARQVQPYQAAKGERSPVAFVSSALDIIFFRRLFASSKVMWLGSWSFHIAFVLVVLRHLRYFLIPLPDCIRCVQPFGIAAGYVLAFSSIYVLIARTVARIKYVSFQNYVILGLLFFISATGLLMRNFFRPDLIDVKSFAMGIVAFRPAPLPDNFFFVVHFSFALILIPYLPFHIFTAPLIALEARRRQQGLDMVMHGK